MTPVRGRFLTNASPHFYPDSYSFSSLLVSFRLDLPGLLRLNLAE
jgi:hypothetical protein